MELDAVTRIAGEGSATSGGEERTTRTASRSANGQFEDEVLEVADDFSDLVVNAMSQTHESDPEAEPQASLVDDLVQAETPSPNVDKGLVSEATGPVSLEEEWAKLLEEEGHSGSGSPRQ
jgi:hypothetical protein